jgi:hypothetical protein
MVFLKIFIFLMGALLTGRTIFSAVQTFLLPRSASDFLVSTVFRSVRRIFEMRLMFAHSFVERDRILALYAPFSLLALLPFWLSLITLGYTAMIWAAGGATWSDAFRLSGSALLTLGFAKVEGPLQTILVFTEATIGLMLIALLIAYLPSMYNAFSRREMAVSLLEVRAGSPPSAVEMLKRFYRVHGLERLGEQWQVWENWFAEIDESHTSLPALVFFRSPRPDRSWVTAAGAVLDAASLTRSVVDIPPDPRADLCIRAGFLALRSIASFFRVPFNPDPHFPAESIQVSRVEFDLACQELELQGLPLKADREQAWLDFAGWRVNYDRVLLALAAITLAPASPWTGNRPQNAPQTSGL